MNSPLVEIISNPLAAVSAEKYEGLWTFLLIWGVINFVISIGAGFYFVVKYRRKREGETTPAIHGNYLVEFLSIFFTSVFVAVIFIWGWNDYKEFRTAKLNEYEINVLGQQWSWQIQYANGKSLVNELYVPRGRPVHLIMTSKDVLHSFYIPAFRVKQDTVPGQYTSLRFHATKTGTFDLFCAEYCGTTHSGMIGKVHVVEPEEFQAFLDGTFKAKPVLAGKDGKPMAAPKTMAEVGAVLYKTKTCNTCHSVDGSRLVGPSFKGLFGRPSELASGAQVQVDENYIRESLMDPMKKLVKGYPPQMPTFRGMISDEEVNQLIAYIKSLK